MARTSITSEPPEFSPKALAINENPEFGNTMGKKTYCSFRLEPRYPHCRQWGVSANPATHSAVCQFPISFSNTHFTVLGVGYVQSTDQTWTHTVNEMYDLRLENRAIFRLSAADGPQVGYAAIGY